MDYQKKWTGHIRIADEVKLVNEIAKKYSSLERAIMEYIDNAIDDADDAANANRNKYPYPIEISITIDRTMKSISIRDNCRGIDFNTLDRIVSEIGESKKKGLSWVNGQFGFGVHAFRGFCDRMFFRTKNKDDKHYTLSIFRNFKKVHPPKVESSPFLSKSGTGTVVKLEQFHDNIFEETTVDKIKSEIESHFETILNKGDIKITVSEKGSVPKTCVMYNYRILEGEDFKGMYTVDVDGSKYPIEIYLKVSNIPVSNKEARFFAKGRRIMAIKDDKSFMAKSKYKTQVWGHPNLTGYVEVADMLEPVITRDSFERGKKRTKFYEFLLSFEEKLKDALDTINNKYDNKALNNIENAIAQILRDIARTDAMRFRKEIAESGADTSGNYGKDGKHKTIGADHTGEKDDIENDINEDLDEDTPHKVHTDNNKHDKEEADDGSHTGRVNKKSGFGIKLSNIPIDADGKCIRSQYNDGIIMINIDHPDYKDRVKKTVKGAMKIDDRLVSYIAAVISIHYKDQYYEKRKKEPSLRTELFDEQVEFIFNLEARLAPVLKELVAKT